MPSEPVVESNLPVWSSCWNYGFGDLQGSIALCRNNIAEPMPFGTKTQKDYIQIHGRKIDKITIQFVSWSQYMVRTFLTGGTCGFSSVLKWLAVPLPLHSPQQCMVFEFFLHVCFFCRHLRRTYSGFCMLCHKRLQNPASKMYVHLLEICMHLGCSFDLIPKRRGPNIV